MKNLFNNHNQLKYLSFHKKFQTVRVFSSFTRSSFLINNNILNLSKGSLNRLHARNAFAFILVSDARFNHNDSPDNINRNKMASQNKNNNKNTPSQISSLSALDNKKAEVSRIPLRSLKTISETYGADFMKDVSPLPAPVSLIRKKGEPEVMGKAAAGGNRSRLNLELSPINKNRDLTLYPLNLETGVLKGKETINGSPVFDKRIKVGANYSLKTNSRLNNIMSEKKEVRLDNRSKNKEFLNSFGGERQAIQKTSRYLPSPQAQSPFLSADATAYAMSGANAIIRPLNRLHISESEGKSQWGERAGAVSTLPLNRVNGRKAGSYKKRELGSNFKVLNQVNTLSFPRKVVRRRIDKSFVSELPLNTKKIKENNRKQAKHINSLMMSPFYTENKNNRIRSVSRSRKRKGLNSYNWSQLWKNKISYYFNLGSYTPDHSDKLFFSHLTEIRENIKSKYTFNNFLSSSQSITYNFNKNIKKVDLNSLYKILKSFFNTLSTLISVPALEYSPDKIKIRLFYYKLPSFSEMKKHKKYQRYLRSDQKLFKDAILRGRFQNIMTKFKMKLFIAKWKQENHLIIKPKPISMFKSISLASLSLPLTNLLRPLTGARMDRVLNGLTAKLTAMEPLTDLTEMGGPFSLIANRKQKTKLNIRKPLSYEKNLNLFLGTRYSNENLLNVIQSLLPNVSEMNSIKAPLIFDPSNPKAYWEKDKLGLTVSDLKRLKKYDIENLNFLQGQTSMNKGGAIKKLLYNSLLYSGLMNAITDAILRVELSIKRIIALSKENSQISEESLRDYHLTLLSLRAKYRSLLRYSLLNTLNESKKVKSKALNSLLEPHKTELEIKKDNFTQIKNIKDSTMVSNNIIKFNKLIFILEKMFKKTIILDLVRLKYPYHESNILAQILGFSSKTYRFRLIMRKLLYVAIIKNPTKMVRKQNFSVIPSYLSGVKVRLAGRLLTQRLVPRFTVQNYQFGSLARGKIHFTDSSRVTLKNKRGAYSLTVTTSHILDK
jgi:hypothetical protein